MNEYAFGYHPGVLNKVLVYFRKPERKQVDNIVEKFPLTFQILRSYS
jgi:hypothetical protein